MNNLMQFPYLVSSIFFPLHSTRTCHAHANAAHALRARTNERAQIGIYDTISIIIAK